MRLAWFHPATHVSDRLDDTVALIRALASEHDIHVVDETRAHDFIRLDFRTPFDLCVFELDDTPHHAYIWPYLLHVPGVLRLRSRSLHESRAYALRRRPDDLGRELAFSDWDLIGAPIVASRLTVVSDNHVAARLQRGYPSARVRTVPVGIGNWGQSRGQTPGQSKGQTPGQSQGQSQGLTPIAGSLGGTNAGVVRRAVDRAREAGAHLELIDDASHDRILDQADVIVAVSWPRTDDPTPILAAMATGKAVIALETEVTAGWPALDPQTWQPRGWTGDAPMLVTIDPRDEEHSLSLALRRLAHDQALRDALGASAYEWWRQHATVDHAARAWRSIIDEAASLVPRQRPDGWPSHLTADGTERARAILGEFAASVDFLVR